MIRQKIFSMDGYLPIPAEWMYKAPEELLPRHDELIFTSAMDTYSFSCVVYSVRTFILNDASSHLMLIITRYLRGMNLSLDLLHTLAM